MGRRAGREEGEEKVAARTGGEGTGMWVVGKVPQGVWLGEGRRGGTRQVEVHKGEVNERAPDCQSMLGL